jgi:hypothetical protein
VLQRHEYGDGFVIENGSPERDRLADEIMKVLIKRETNLADGMDALTTVEINVFKDNYEGARAKEFNLLYADFYEHVNAVLGIDEKWKASHPDGRVVDRDLNASVIPQSMRDGSGPCTRRKRSDSQP